MNAKTQRLCVWCGPAMIVVWLIGFWTFAGFVPPPAPGLSKEQVADLFRDNGFAIRLGLVLTCFGSALLGPFVGVLSVQLRRIEGPHSPLANSQMVLGAAMPLIFIFPVVILQVAAYRPKRSAEAIQLLYDLGWILFIAVVTTVVVQLVVTAIAILGDSRTSPVFPRWAGFLTVWVSIMLCPGSVCMFFYDGPLAWNGLFTWWLPLSSFAIWFAVMTWLLLRAIREQELVALPGGGGGSGGSADERIERLESEVGRLRSELAGLAGRAR
jgi:hypothetical protein